MRSRADAFRHRGAATGARWPAWRRRLAAGLLSACAAGTAPGAPGSAIATPEQVRQAADEVAADPALGRQTTERTLRLKRDEPTRKSGESDRLAWLEGLVKFLAEGGRWIVWGLLLLGAGAAIFAARRWLRTLSRDDEAGAIVLPTHVRDLDIRPESLPDDIAAAARAAWAGGDARAALSLLYRGALSRLVHQHGLAIGAASTEGECVQLAFGGLPAPAAGYFERLVGAWQLVVYGARMPEAARMQTLLGEFDDHLPPARQAAAT